MTIPRMFAVSAGLSLAMATHQRTALPWIVLGAALFGMGVLYVHLESRL